jgi:hypothetical protein
VVKVLQLPHWLGSPLRSIYVTNDHGYVPFAIISIQPFPHWWLITVVVTRIARRVPYVKQKLLSPFRDTWVRFRCLIGFLLLDLWFSVYHLVDCCLSLLFRRSLLVLFRFTTSDYPFGICTHFIHLWNRPRWSYIYNWLVRSFFSYKVMYVKYL